MQSLVEKPESYAASKPKEQQWKADHADSTEQRDGVPSYYPIRRNSNNILEMYIDRYEQQDQREYNRQHSGGDTSKKQQYPAHARIIGRRFRIGRQNRRDSPLPGLTHNLTQNVRPKMSRPKLQNLPSGSCEEIVYRANNVIAKLTGVGKLRM
jgi:hypothetical protein